MTYISREEALAIEHRREQVLQKHGVTFPEYVSGRLAISFPTLLESGKLEERVGAITDQSGADHILDFLDATVPPVYIPNSVERTHARTREAWTLDFADASEIADGITQRGALGWINFLPIMFYKELKVGITTALLDGNALVLDRFFTIRPSYLPHRNETLATIITTFVRGVSPRNIPNYFGAAPHLIPELTPVEVASREILRASAENMVLDMSPNELKSHLKVCAEAYTHHKERVDRSVRLELSQIELDRRHPIFESLIRRGVPGIIARAVTTKFRRMDRESITADEANSYAEGWTASKGMPAPLVSELMGLPGYVVESALLAEKLGCTETVI